jgi:hypothetical protein
LLRDSSILYLSFNIMNFFSKSSFFRICQMGEKPWFGTVEYEENYIQLMGHVIDWYAGYSRFTHPLSFEATAT